MGLAPLLASSRGHLALLLHLLLLVLLLLGGRPEGEGPQRPIGLLLLLLGLRASSRGHLVLLDLLLLVLLLLGERPEGEGPELPPGLLLLLLGRRALVALGPDIELHGQIF